MYLLWDLIVRVVCERESVCVCVWRLKQIEDWRVFAGNSWLSILQNDAYALHMTGMQRVGTGWRQLCFANSSRVRPSRETLTKYSVLPDCPIWYAFSVPTPYLPTLPTNVEEYFWEKNPSHKPWELEVVIPTILYTIACQFSSTPTSPFPYHWEVDSPNTYHTLSKCQVRIWCY